MPIADRAHARHGGAETIALAQPAHFVDESELEHGVEALCDPFVQDSALGHERETFSSNGSSCLATPCRLDSGLPVSRQTSSAR